LCEGLIKAGKQLVLLIQADASINDSDTSMAQAIKSQVDGAFRHSKRVTHSQFLQSVICHAGMVVAVGYHTAVLALAGGKVPYNLYYSNKGKDLCDRLNIPDADIHEFDPDTELQAILSTHNRAFDSKALAHQVT